jgi:hypothetical protein
MRSDQKTIAEKVNESQQVMLKELQGNCDQISDNVHKISFNFYKSFDSKIEDFKNSFERFSPSTSASPTVTATSRRPWRK